MTNFKIGCHLVRVGSPNRDPSRYKAHSTNNSPLLLSGVESKSENSIIISIIVIMRKLFYFWGKQELGIGFEQNNRVRSDLLVIINLRNLEKKKNAKIGNTQGLIFYQGEKWETAANFPPIDRCGTSPAGWCRRRERIWTRFRSSPRRWNSPDSPQLRALLRVFIFLCVFKQVGC